METGKHVAEIISILNDLHIKYAFTGGFSLSYYAFPRASSDIDILIEKNGLKLARLTQKLQTLGFNVIETDVKNAIKECSRARFRHQWAHTKLCLDVRRRCL